MDRPEPPPKPNGIPVTPELYKWLNDLLIKREINSSEFTKAKLLIHQRCDYGLKKYIQCCAIRRNIELIGHSQSKRKSGFNDSRWT